MHNPVSQPISQYHLILLVEKTYNDVDVMRHMSCTMMSAILMSVSVMENWIMIIEASYFLVIGEGATMSLAWRELRNQISALDKIHETLITLRL
jgi:hypothetical protein